MLIYCLGKNIREWYISSLFLWLAENVFHPVFAALYPKKSWCKQAYSLKLVRAFMRVKDALIVKLKGKCFLKIKEDDSSSSEDSSDEDLRKPSGEFCSSRNEIAQIAYRTHIVLIRNALIHQHTWSRGRVQ
jgi:hypothetical protein